MKKALCCILAMWITATGYSQGVHFTQFNATPLLLNPAYTGIMNGSVRANALYRSQWGSVTVPFVSAYTSVDWRNRYFKNADYFGIGGSVLYTKAGDGTLKNFTGTGSFAYHKSIRATKKRPASVALGVQGGYSQQSIDVQKLYFPNSAQYYQLGISNSIRHWSFNAGTAFSQKLNERANYIVGLSVNNINQPNDALLKKQTSEVGLDMQYTVSAGANLQVAERFSLRPAIIFLSRAAETNFIAGNEFSFRLGKGKSRTYVFLGFWYTSSEALMLTGGLAKGAFRVTGGYDYNLSSLNSASNGNGGFELSVTYIAANNNTRKRMPVSSNRF